MKVSIITVCYNSEKTIRDTIQSVVSQKYPNIEYIIVDGVSKDGTVSIVQSFKDRISHFISEPDNGIYDAMNKGIALATGDIVGFLNSDDMYVDSDVVDTVTKQFGNDRCDAVYGGLVYVHPKDLRKVFRVWKSGPFHRFSFLFGWMPPHPSFFVKREIFQKYGMFNTKLKLASDYEMMLRLLYKHQIAASYVPKVLVRMRLGGISNASIFNRIRAHREDREAWRLNGLRPYIFTIWLKPLRKIFQFFVYESTNLPLR